MKAYASTRGGLCMLEERQEWQLVNIVNMTPVEKAIAHIVAGAFDDWESVDAPDRATLLNGIRTRHSCARCVANIEACIAGVSPELEAELLAEVEDFLKTFDQPKKLLAMLLCAPLVSPDAMKLLTTACLSSGHAATAHILEQVWGFQPHLRRLTDRWLSIPEECFAAISGGRQQVWRKAIAAGILADTMEASSFLSVKKLWDQLIFAFSLPTERLALARISVVVAEALFPDHADSARRASVRGQELDEELQQAPLVGNDARASYLRAIKQVEAIAAAVADGHDSQARKYLRELVESQLAYADGVDHVTKSLCNIAKQCAEMFRTDFEYECLQSAIEINACDGWALIQLADHYKRVGRFAEAMGTLDAAHACGEGVIVETSRADVYAQQGNYEQAMEIYASITLAEQDPTIRTAKADVLRRWGHLADADREYREIIREGVDSHRAFAGLADIAKRSGNLDEARDLYLDVLRMDDLEPTSRWVYMMSLSQVYVRRGELTEAYPLTDEAVQLRPFSRQARALRAAIAGLLGDPADAINDLPHLGQTRAFHEWVNEYVRGLLLLMLKRYTDAREALLQNVEERLLDKDASGMLSLGAAVCFLRSRSDMARAKEILDRIPSMDDAFADAIRVSLAYHVAVSLRETAEIKRLEIQLASVKDTDLNHLKAAISRRDWRAAWGLEVRVLLRLAA